jgi:hypothetical protein
MWMHRSESPPGRLDAGAAPHFRFDSPLSSAELEDQYVEVLPACTVMSPSPWNGAGFLAHIEG